MNSVTPGLGMGHGWYSAGPCPDGDACVNARSYGSVHPAPREPREEDLPPPVVAWFVDLHRRYTPGDNARVTRVKFAIEGTVYTIFIERQQKEVKWNSIG